MASESNQRKVNWTKSGCNAFNTIRPTSRPLSFWTTSDVWEYIKKNNLPYSKIYDMGYEQTGCTLCLFGCQYDDVRGFGKFEKYRQTHPGLVRLAEKWGVFDILKVVRKAKEKEDA